MQTSRPFHIDLGPQIAGKTDEQIERESLEWLEGLGRKLSAKKTGFKFKPRNGRENRN